MKDFLFFLEFEQDLSMDFFLLNENLSIVLVYNGLGYRQLAE